MTQQTHHHFGFSGQDNDEDYDNLFCIGRKCKRRKQERHMARMAKRESKTDQRRAETEQMRAETAVMTGMAQKPTAPVSRAVAAPTLIQAAPAAAPQVAQAGLGSNKLMMAVVALIVGGMIYQNMKKKPGTAGMPVASPFVATS